MAISDNEKVRVGPLKRGGLFWLAWRQQVLIGGEREVPHVVQLKARSLDKITELGWAIGEVVSTHGQWDALQHSSTRLEGANTLKRLVLEQNKKASALLSANKIYLKGFILPESTTKHVR